MADWRRGPLCNEEDRKVQLSGLEGAVVWEEVKYRQIGTKLWYLARF
jgi:hypothetical protein